MAKTDTTHIYVGRWAVCSVGKIGKIEKAIQQMNGVLCKGIGLDQKPWSAHNPRLLHKSYNDKFDAELRA
jgi:hypothetical protein